MIGYASPSFPLRPPPCIGRAASSSSSWLKKKVNVNISREEVCGRMAPQHTSSYSCTPGAVDPAGWYYQKVLLGGPGRAAAGEPDLLIPPIRCTMTFKAYTTHTTGREERGRKGRQGLSSSLSLSPIAWVESGIYRFLYSFLPLRGNKVWRKA